MVYVFQRFLSCPNNKHHIVMYIGLFYHCWQHETCEQTQGDLFQSLSTAACGKRHLACHHINFSYFAWQKFALFFVFWVYALMARRTLCIVVVFVILAIISVAPWSTVSYLWLSAEHVFLIMSLYSSLFTFHANKLPSVYYVLCDQVTYHTFNSTILLE